MLYKSTFYLLNLLKRKGKQRQQQRYHNAIITKSLLKYGKWLIHIYYMAQKLTISDPPVVLYITLYRPNIT